MPILNKTIDGGDVIYTSNTGLTVSVGRYQVTTSPGIRLRDIDPELEELARGSEVSVATYATDPSTGAVTGLVGPDGEAIPLNGVPFDTVSISSTTAAIRSAPCQVAGLSCSASSSLNVRVHANSANSGTVIWEGALTIGQIVTLPEPYASFLGVSVQFVSGTGTIALYVR